MDIRGEKRMVTVNLPAMYNIYNAIGAVAAVTEMGLGADAAIAALADFQCGFGRMERFALGKGGARMMLVKNPAGCNQVIEFLEKFALKNSVLASCGYCHDVFTRDNSTTIEFNCASRSYYYDGDVVSYYGNSNVDWIGDDGTKMGAEGGATPYTLTPTVMPKVTYLYTNVSDGVVDVHVQATSNDKQNN